MLTIEEVLKMNMPECVNKWTAAFAERLNKDSIVVEKDALDAAKQLFLHVMNNGVVSEGAGSEEYIEDLALKIEFQIMLKGFGADDTVTKADLDQFTKDLFGVEMGEAFLTKEKVGIEAGAPASNAAQSAETTGNILSKSNNAKQSKLHGCVEEWVAAFAERLNKDRFAVEKDALDAAKQLFLHAMDRGEMSEETDPEEYIKDIALKIEFQSMLKGAGAYNTVTKADVDQLTRDLFGEEIEAQSLIQEKKKVDIVASVPVSEKKEKEPLKAEKSMLPPEAKKTTDAKSTTEVKSTENASGDLTVLDALKNSGKYSTKKDEKKNVVPDMFMIDKATQGIPAKDHVLFVCYTLVAYCSLAKLKRTKNMTMKVPFLDNHSRVFVITESSIILSSMHTTEKNAIVIPRSDIVGIVHVFEKKLTSVGQAQITLNNGTMIVITIDREISGPPEKKQFDDFKEKMEKFLGQNQSGSVANRDEEKTKREDVIKYVQECKASAIAFQGELLEPDQYQNPYISMIDRCVAFDLVRELITIYDKYLSSEIKEIFGLYVLESCVGGKLNTLLHDELYDSTDMTKFFPNSRLPEDAYSKYKDIEKKYSTRLDVFMEFSRKRYIEHFKK